MKFNVATRISPLLPLIHVLAVQAVALPACDDLSADGCSLPAAQEMFSDLAKKGWAVYLVAQPPDANTAGLTPTSASIKSAIPTLVAAKLPNSSSRASISLASASQSSGSALVSATISPSSTAASSTAPATSTTTAATPSPSAQPSPAPKLKFLGIILAIVSGFLIGSSFVFKKKGLLRSQATGTAGQGVRYLKSPLWWLGMSMMILGELCNFAAYAFVEAIVVTPLGALSVVVCAILSSIFLKERLTFIGWLGCGLCILGATVIALNAPKEATVGQILDFQKLFLSVIFLAYVGVLLVASLLIIFVVAPRFGKTNMLWYILVCSMIGGISVSVTTGLGAAIVTTVGGDNQFKHWFIFVLIPVVLGTLVAEVYYLNVALALFNTAMVTPTYYVIFTFSIVTTLVLFRGLAASIPSIITLVVGFLVICVGIVILQISKSDAAQQQAKAEQERSSTFLAWSPTEISEKKTTTRSESVKYKVGDPEPDTPLPAEKSPPSLINAPRGSLGLTLVGMIQAWRHEIDPDAHVYPDDSSFNFDSSEVDIGEQSMYQDDNYVDARGSQASWRLRGRGDALR